jgi:hypothetical protein
MNEKKYSFSITNLSEKAYDVFIEKKSRLGIAQKKASISNGEVMEEILCPSNPGIISDGYHTFNELYEHRIVLYMAFCKSLEPAVWKSKKHSDGSTWEGWFLLGIFEDKGKQITYHLPEKYWDQCQFKELDQAPEFDGHTSAEVLKRISQL